MQSQEKPKSKFFYLQIASMNLVCVALRSQIGLHSSCEKRILKSFISMPFLAFSHDENQRWVKQESNLNRRKVSEIGRMNSSVSGLSLFLPVE